MPEQTSRNVEIVRGLYDAFARRDNESPFEVFDPEIEWDASGTGFPGFNELLHGHEGVRKYWRQWLDAWEAIEFTVENVFDAGDRVVVFVRQRNKGKLSGIWVDQEPYAQIWTLGNGKVVRMQIRWDRDEALRECGLPAEG
jgi:ketosteroid isomerase-like protein